MGVTLFTSRVILQTLGVDDYGVYNVVGGIVAMFSFVSGSLTVSSQRFITFEIGKKSNNNVSNVFSVCITLHLLLGILIALIAEPIGYWYIYNKLMIPDSRLIAALWVFQFSILSMIIVFLTVPYTALIIAHEKMKAFALVSSIDALLRLFVAYAIICFKESDSLVIYAVLIFCAQLITSLCYILYCKNVFKEIKLIWGIDKKLLIDMGRFASWSVMGNLAYVTYTQGLNLLLGTFFSPAVNAARGVAVQIQSAVNSFVNSFQTAINPQITKNYASGNIGEMVNLVYKSSRFSFYLLMLLSIPVLLRTNDILELWLSNIPNYTAVFVKIILLTTWINSIANPLIVSVKATGKVKTYELVVGALMISILPISYVFLKRGYDPEIVFIVHLIIECIAMICRIMITKRLIEFSYSSYLRDVILKVLTVAVVSFFISYYISSRIPDGALNTIVVFILSVIASIVTIFLIGLDKSERMFVLRKFLNNE